MIVYRIQHRDHPTDGAWGVCQAAQDAIAQALNEGAFIASDHPNPYRDFGCSPNFDEFCAFPSLDAYRAWFTTPTVRAALYKSGKAHLMVYEVEPTERSMLQCLFRFEDVTSSRPATPEEYS